MYCTVLYCTLLYSTIVYCTLLYSTVLFCTLLYCTVFYSTLLYFTVLYSTALHRTALYCTVLFCIDLYCTVLYVTKPVLLKRSVRIAYIWSNCSVDIPSLFQAIQFLQTLLVILSAPSWVMATNWITNHRIRPDPAPVWSQLPLG